MMRTGVSVDECDPLCVSVFTVDAAVVVPEAQDAAPNARKTQKTHNPIKMRSGIFSPSAAKDSQRYFSTNVFF